MTVHCPHCSTGYLLPDHLVGPRGARVRCPTCEGTFVVLARSAGHGRHDAAPSPPNPASPAQEARRWEEPDAVAASVLEALVATLGDDLVDARRRGRVLSTHGPKIMDAYAEYRRRAGAGAAPDPFRTELERRCGVDLIPRRPG
jgi:predicted Zn finger-like uncharacterized protein